MKKTLDEGTDLRKTRNKDRASASVLVQFAELYNLQFVLMADLMIPDYYAFCDKLYINYYQYDLNTRMTKSDDIIFFQISFERIKGLSQHYLNLGSLVLLK